MDYFSILKLNKEPFSNSPDPEFFFQSRQHLNCLQKVELSLRLRRGLNVVIGDVGTGKTTLCRQIIRGFANDAATETHLILDPHFSSSSEFLATIAEMLEGDKPPAGSNDWQVKEIIKQYIFRKGVDEKKTVILIIDEGQKIPPFCLEILREFLNYETNEYKLLQIVIFAQKEFENTLKAHDNFADRINLYHLLGPLNFQDTRMLIQFRIRQASEVSPAPTLFTFPALWTIYRATGGYPRKIINLCHQCILAMIIQNRTKAGKSTVRSCVERRASQPSRRSLRVAVAALITVAALALIAGVPHEKLKIPVEWKNLVLLKSNLPDDSPPAGVPQVKNQTDTEKSRAETAPLHLTALEKPSTRPVERPATVPLTDNLADNPAPTEPPISKPATKRMDDPPPTERSASEPEIKTPVETRLNEHPTSKQEADGPDDKKQMADLETDSKALPEKPVEKNELPLLLGQVALKRNDSLWRLIEKIYGVFTYQHLNSLMKVNPQIRHPDHTEVGQLIYVPAIPAPVEPLPTEVWWIKIGEEDHLDTAINRLSSYPQNAPPIRIVPYWNRRIGLKFAVILKDYFFDEASARNQLSKLLPLVSPKGKVLSSWIEDTVFFADPLLFQRRREQHHQFGFQNNP